MSAKKKKKKRPTFVAENENVQIPIYTIKHGRLDKEVKVPAAMEFAEAHNVLEGGSLLEA
ncbi:MAG: hypothetical protein ACLQM8_05625 [Limisphaerales bacterium]